MDIVDKSLIRKLENSILYIFIIWNASFTFMCNSILLILRMSIFITSYVNLIVFHVNPIYNTHSGEKPHKCVVCGLMLVNPDLIFVCYYAYRDKIPGHNEDKPAECNVCDKVFVKYTTKTNDKNTSMCDANANYTSHTGEKPPKCTVLLKRLCKLVNH